VNIQLNKYLKPIIVLSIIGFTISSGMSDEKPLKPNKLDYVSNNKSKRYRIDDEVEISVDSRVFKIKKILNEEDWFRTYALIIGVTVDDTEKIEYEKEKIIFTDCYTDNIIKFAVILSSLSNDDKLFDEEIVRLKKLKNFVPENF